MRLILKYLLHTFNYAFRTKVLGNKIPFIAGLVLNNECNLNCVHCGLKVNETKSLTFEQLSGGLDEMYSLGIRSIAITGGEPFLWRDGSATIHDVLSLINRKKFLVTSIYTNGTFPINIACDNVFVSLDGTEITTNKLRGPVFREVIQNISGSKHPKIFVNFTINRSNYHEIEAFCEYIKSIPAVKGIFFYFHTPYYGIDELHLERKEKIDIALRLLKLKSKYRILNRTAALKDYIHNDWPRPSDVCVVYSEHGRIVRCCRAIANKEACEHCGYLGYLEVIDIIRFRLSAFYEALNYLPSSSSRNSYV